MAYQPFRCTVVDNQKISPNFRKITFSAPGMGPADRIYDLRVKLLLHDDPIDMGEDWHASLSVAQRESLRTYSIRDRRVTDEGTFIDVVFVEHPGGLASDWATQAAAGDQLIIIAPDAQDTSGVGIEFKPGQAKSAYLFGDETAAPAIARIAEEWPEGLQGKAFIEISEEANKLVINSNGCQVHYLVRGQRPLGELLYQHLSELLDLNGELGDTSYNEETLIWETPRYSNSGEVIPQQQLPSPSDHYYWIAGESGVVKAMRRAAVKDAGVPRSQVSFMGYWKK